MKKNTLSLALVASLMLGLGACQKEAITPAPNVQGIGENTPTTPISQLPTTTVQGEITSNTTWSATNRYLMKGFVYVRSGATLTIEAGTIIKGDKDTKGTLIIEPGAKIMAMGTAAKPIVFTSNQPKGSRNYGDWGGVVIAGNAPVNSADGTSLPQAEGGITTKYGSLPTIPENQAAVTDNSGTLQYIRIEFAGVALTPNNELNGLTFDGVGNGTTVDHIQISYSGDDAIEWFGGTVNAKYLVTHRTFDDDFDTDNGFSGKVQFAVALRDPLQADQSGSKAFESDNDANGSARTPLTSAVFSNVTTVGPILNPTGSSYSPQYTAGAHIRRNSAQTIMNSVIMGFPTNILIDNATTAGNVAKGDLRFKNNIAAGALTGSNSKGGQRGIIYVGPNGGAGSLTANSVMSSDTAAWSTAIGPLTWFGSNTNRRYTTSDEVRLANPFNLTAPSFVPLSTSPIVYTDARNPTTPVVAANFTDSKTADSFFTKVNYIGAFSGSGASADNWLAGWTNFDPQNTDY